ncbi:Aste57867_458 [Aphanomyces stellatus]|uniref:Aste57867_458 protein n=1 Tax=Aphanomyces stellatus TaxID=120398 RepID=A0A485K7N4_9STRA|nr:hypothetical protein As57867_000457 [Aphanomyces stellatus]VFT77683.1 Aste57867_458 [Aphanomyces stellatus]
MEVDDGTLQGRLIGIFTSPLGQTAGLTSIAIGITYYYVGNAWSINDAVFVVAVAAVVFFHRYLVKSYIEHDPKQRLLDVTVPAFPLEGIDYVQGDTVHLGKSDIIAVLFFATWCKGSRAALHEFQKVVDQYSPHVKFLALTQESKAELQAYEVHGTKASSFKSLGDFDFAIAVEDGTLTKEYQLKHKVDTLPHVYIVGRDDSVFWHGHPVGHFDDATRRTLAYDFSKPSRSKLDKIK